MTDSNSMTLFLPSDHPAKKRKMNPPTFKDPMSTIKLTVGEGETAKTFLVHKEAAIAMSPIIAKYVEESGQDHYLLKDSTERAVRLLVQYTYSQDIVIEQLRDGHDFDSPRDDDIEEDLALVELWILAKELEIPSLQDLTIRTIDDIYRKCGFLASHCVPAAYDLTSSGSELRRLFVALCAHTDPSSITLADVDVFPQEFLCDLAIFLLEKLQDSQKVYNVSDFYCKDEVND
ncbi:uncharacterized protein PAC_00988 [Phialocephala subalpina]|uniref:BTB domain-containing protein n=1 Tax=Phialocephala subalpina TaxID=576137 RepID=A0A1L7WEA5_9HELO|nr:uncharacterized protein PAC_00988 [Phialocephala subalpina]